MTQKWFQGKDIGCRQDKNAHIVDGTMTLTSIHNLVASGIPKATGVELDGMDTFRRGDQAKEVISTNRDAQLPDIVSWNGGLTVMVNEHVTAYSRNPIQRIDFGRFGDTLETRAVTYDAWFHMFGPGEHIVYIVLGFPVQVLSADNAQAHRDETSAWLMGEHPFTVNSQPCTVTVKAIRFVAQPVGAFCEFVLDNNGSFVREAEMARAEIAVLDQGYNTLDLFVLQNGQVSNYYTTGDNLGMRQAARNLMQMVQDMHGRKLSPIEADEMIIRHANHPTDPIEITANGQGVHITQLVSTAVESATGAVIDYVNGVWGDGGQFRYLLLTGGGCLVMGDALKRHLKNAILLPDPITANARGLAKMAQRKGVFK